MKLFKYFVLGGVALLNFCANIALAQSQTISIQSHVAGMSWPDLDRAVVQIKAKAIDAPNIPASATALAVEYARQNQVRAVSTKSDAAFSAATVAPPVVGCFDVNLNSAYNSTTAPTGQTDCYEFIAPNNAAASYAFTDSENISHLAPGGYNVARTAFVGVKVCDSTGNIVRPGGIRRKHSARKFNFLFSHWPACGCCSQSSLQALKSVAVSMGNWLAM